MAYYLLENENPNAPVRSDGRRYWGYPTRLGGVQPSYIALHTAENAVDLVPPDTGAERIANYFTGSTRPASYHTIVDTDTRIDLLPTSYTAFHVRGYNAAGLGLSMATRAAKWDEIPDYHVERLLNAAATVAAEWCVEFDIPVRFVTKAELDAGVDGITGHTNLDPTRRYDPGFGSGQWTDWLERVQREVDRMAATNVLRIGHAGHAVTGVQNALNNWIRELGLSLEPLEVDGVYGEITADYVSRYQAGAQLPDVTGEVDGPTLSWLHEYRVDRVDPDPPPATVVPELETTTIKVVTGYKEG